MHTFPQFTEAAEKSMRFFTCLVETLNTTPVSFDLLRIFRKIFLLTNFADFIHFFRNRQHFLNINFEKFFSKKLFQELYFALKRSLETESARLDPVSLRTAKMLLQDFELSGVLLSDSEVWNFFNFEFLGIFFYFYS